MWIGLTVRGVLNRLRRKAVVEVAPVPLFRGVADAAAIYDSCSGDPVGWRVGADGSLTVPGESKK